MANIQPQIIYVRTGSPGLVAGIFGCVFGILGIFTIGIIFVPLAAICSVIGLARGLGLFRGFTDVCGSGIGVSLLGGVLTVVGFGFSPTLWLLAATTATGHGQ